MTKSAKSAFSALYTSAAWSLLGNVLPMVAALAAVPFLLHYLGQERLGVLSLVWVVIGYFSFLDMGLGLRCEGQGEGNGNHDRRLALAISPERMFSGSRLRARLTACESESRGRTE